MENCTKMEEKCIFYNKSLVDSKKVLTFAEQENRHSKQGFRRKGVSGFFYF